VINGLDLTLKCFSMIFGILSCYDITEDSKISIKRILNATIRENNKRIFLVIIDIYNNS
jgi:hypothetical protein